MLVPQRLLRSSEGELDAMIEELQRELKRRERNGELEHQLVETRNAKTDESKKLGGYQWEMVRCKKDCECNGGKGHGPYLYRYSRGKNGKMKSEYIGVKVDNHPTAPPRPEPEDARQIKPLPKEEAAS